MEITRCRIKRSYWWALLFMAVFCGSTIYGAIEMAQGQPDGKNWPGTLFFGGAALGFLGLCFWILRSVLYEVIIADEIGLRWRGVFGDWKSARWEHISDFYIEKLRVNPTIETPNGKIKIGTDFSESSKKQLMALIAERAINAPARVWEKAEYRASKGFVKRFDYWTNSQKWLAPIMSLGAIYLVIYLGWILFVEQPRTTEKYALSWSWDVLSILMIVMKLGPAAIPIFVSPYILWRDRKFAFARRDEHLEISPRGLAWQRGQARIKANWDEIRVVRYVVGDRQNAHFLIETQNGDFLVWRSLETISLWVRLVNQFAPQLAPEIPTYDPALGAESATWSGGVVGNGARIFHFRTRDTRLFLWGATAIAPLIPLAPFLSQSMKTPDDSPAAIPVKALSLALFLIVLALTYAWLCFVRAAIWADENGLEWRFPFWKTRRVLWSEIESYGSDDGAEWIVASGKKRRLWLVSEPVRGSELREIIASRAINAAGKWL